ncbi:MAG: DUF3386 domain-containing protein [Nitrospirales bacterium]|nr:DUF3386 family protein [Nitrospira sp.]MDR4502697.1 DUF3386 domain-containing protein [Nitrospirales bacterium]
MEMYTREENETTVQDDPKAKDLLRGAFNKTARWQPDFSGFEADLRINVDGVETKGVVTVKGPKDVTVNIDDEELKKWAENQIGMIAVHRGPRNFEESDGKYALTLDGDDHHPLGQRVTIHGDGMGSWYRVKDNRITQINRKMPYVAFTINVEDSAITEDQKYLTTRYTVYYFSPKDGSLKNVESFSDTHVRVGASDLPATRRIISYENNAIVTKTLTFENHHML